MSNYLIISANVIGNQLTCFLYVTDPPNIGELVFYGIPNLRAVVPSGIVGTIPPGPHGGKVTRTIYLDLGLFNQLCGYAAPYVLDITTTGNDFQVVSIDPVDSLARTAATAALRTPDPKTPDLKHLEKTVELLVREFPTEDERLILAAKLLKIILPAPRRDVGHVHRDGNGTQSALLE